MVHLSVHARGSNPSCLLIPWLISLLLLFVESEVNVLVAQLCLTLCDPMDCSPSGSSIHGIFQARILEWVVISFSRGSSQPRDWTQVSCIASRFFTVWATGNLLCNMRKPLSGYWDWQGGHWEEAEPELDVEGSLTWCQKNLSRGIGKRGHKQKQTVGNEVFQGAQPSQQTGQRKMEHPHKKLRKTSPKGNWKKMIGRCKE